MFKSNNCLKLRKTTAVIVHCLLCISMGSKKIIKSIINILIKKYTLAYSGRLNVWMSTPVFS